MHGMARDAGLLRRAGRAVRRWLVVAGAAAVLQTGVEGVAGEAGGALMLPAEAAGQRASLRGGRAVMERQHRKANAYDYSVLDTPAEVHRFVELGLLVRLRGNANYRLHQVSFPYARPEVKTFVERLSRQYRSACGEQLVVTSLTRPVNRQPRNASRLSVHPRGMAVDLRAANVPGACRRWLDRVLLDLEGKGALDVTLERYPLHYHVAVFTREYAAYVQQLIERAAQEDATRVAQSLPAPAAPSRYQVRRGDSLWGIARAHGTTVQRLMSLNDLRNSRIQAGETLRVPRAGAPD